MKRFLTTLFMLVLAFSSFRVPVAKAEPAPIDPEAVKAELDAMIISLQEKVEYSILKICGPNHNVCAVAIDPPYREFPNVLLFNFNAKSGKYVRVFEGLCFGIQDGPSGKLDLHTIGMGIDATISEARNQFDDVGLQRMIELSHETGMVVIPYQDCIHLQGPNSNTAGRLYTIDKTKFRDLAVKLIGPVYQKYQPQECTMYDLPNLNELELAYRDGTYIITGVTDNRQQWQVTFTGIDSEDRFLLNKKVEAERIAEQSGNEYDALLQNAQLELEQNPQKALEILDQAKQVDLQAPEAYLYSGLIYYRIGESGQAGIEFQSALEFSSADEKIKQINIIDTTTTVFKFEKEKQLFKEAYDAIETGKSKKAIQLLGKAIKMNPQNVRLYYEIGYAYIEGNDFINAIAYLEKGRGINPAYRFILNELKYAYAETGDIQRLKEVINDISQYYGEDPLLYQELSFAYYQNQLVELAIETLETNLIKFPQYYISYYSLGQIHFLNKNYSEAKELLIIFLKNISEDDFKGYSGSLEDYKQKAQAMIDQCSEEENKGK